MSCRSSLSAFDRRRLQDPLRRSLLFSPASQRRSSAAGGGIGWRCARRRGVVEEVGAGLDGAVDVRDLDAFARGRRRLADHEDDDRSMLRVPAPQASSIWALLVRRAILWVVAVTPSRMRRLELPQFLHRVLVAGSSSGT
jgi:hypothetical protein